MLQYFVTSLVKIYSASTAGNHIGVFLTSVLLFPSKLSYLLRKTIDTLTLAASIVVHVHHCHPHKLVVGKHPRLASFMHKTLSLSTASERNRRLTFKRMFWMVASWSETQNVLDGGFLVWDTECSGWWLPGLRHRCSNKIFGVSVGTLSFRHCTCCRSFSYKHFSNYEAAFSAKSIAYKTVEVQMHL